MVGRKRFLFGLLAAAVLLAVGGWYVGRDVDRYCEREAIGACIAPPGWWFVVGGVAAGAVVAVVGVVSFVQAKRKTRAGQSDSS